MKLIVQEFVDEVIKALHSSVKIRVVMGHLGQRETPINHDKPLSHNLTSQINKYSTVGPRWQVTQCKVKSLGDWS